MKVIFQLALQQFIAGLYTASNLATYFTTVIAGLYCVYYQLSCILLYSTVLHAGQYIASYFAFSFTAL